MAELIPLEYRIAGARRSLIERWLLLVIVSAGVSGAGILSAYAWQRQQSLAYARVDAEYRSKSVLVQEARELQGRREYLATRMKNMLELQNDRILLTLLKDVSGAFSDADRLDFVRIDAHPEETNARARGGAAGKPEPAKYTVRVRGITKNDTTHSQFLERLTEVGSKSRTPVIVPLGEKQTQKLLAGEVTRFDVTCEQAMADGK